MVMKPADEFEIVLKRVGGKVVATIPDLGLMAAGADYAAALGSLEESKRKLMSELEEADLQGLVSSPVAESRNKLLPQLGLFALKSAVLAIVVVVTFGASAGLVLGELYAKFSGPQFLSSLEKKLEEKASSPGIPDSQREKIISNVHVMVDRWQPFVREVSRLWSSSCESRADDKADRSEK
jgi:hypothetical protein